jgi:hypothetical protein
MNSSGRELRYLEKQTRKNKKIDLKKKNAKEVATENSEYLTNFVETSLSHHSTEIIDKTLDVAENTVSQNKPLSPPPQICNTPTQSKISISNVPTPIACVSGISRVGTATRMKSKESLNEIEISDSDDSFLESTSQNIKNGAKNKRKSTLESSAKKQKKTVIRDNKKDYAIKGVTNVQQVCKK